jgi:hypothetical protein
MAFLIWASAFAGVRAGLKAYTPGHLALRPVVCLWRGKIGGMSMEG